MDQESNNKKKTPLRSALESLRTLSLSTILLLAASAVALVAVGSFAWVSRNRNLDSENMQMNIDDALFELSVPTANGQKKPKVIDENWSPQKITVKVNNSTQYDSDGKVVVQNGEGELITGVITDSMLRVLAPDYAVAENTTQTGSGVSGVVCALEIDGEGRTLRPGSTGTLTFRIEPKKTNLQFVGSLSLTALGKRLDGSTVSYERLDDAYFAAYKATNGSDDKRLSAYNFMEGHVLFFTARSNEKTNGYYSYTNGTRLAPGSDFLISSTPAAQPYTVKIYWEWPVTYERLSELIVDSGELQTNSQYYFYEKPGSSELATAFASTDADVKKDILSTAYNSADTEIGKHVSHILAAIEVHLKGENETPGNSIAATAS